MSENTEKTPVEWIQLELSPLPDSPYEAGIAFWNPDTQEVVGEAAELILNLVAEAKSAGQLSSPSLSHFEITEPLSKPSELAAVLAQHFWVIPQPVLAPGLVISEVNETLQ